MASLFLTPFFSFFPLSLTLITGIACTSKQTRPRKAFNNSFFFEKVFGVDEFMAAGVLEIPVNGLKPTKPSKDNNYVSLGNGKGKGNSCWVRSRIRLEAVFSPLLFFPQSQTFVVIEGAVRVKVFKSNFIVAPGGMFLVPRGEFNFNESDIPHSESEHLISSCPSFYL